MAAVFEIRPGKTVRRQPSRKWTPQMAAAYARMAPQARVEHDGEPMAGTQLELFKISWAVIGNIWR